MNSVIDACAFWSIVDTPTGDWSFKTASIYALLVFENWCFHKYLHNQGGFYMRKLQQRRCIKPVVDEKEEKTKLNGGKPRKKRKSKK